MLTRQPMEGKIYDGGLRVGEMERAALIAHGAAHTLYHKLFLCSDPFIATLCKSCGYFAVVKWKKQVKECRNCNDGQNVRLVRTPYAVILLVHELLSMGLAPTFDLEDTDEFLTESQRHFTHV